MQEAVQLETQWQDFAVFANRRLQRTGRCHESEVAAAFAREDPRYRREGAIPSESLPLNPELKNPKS